MKFKFILAFILGCLTPILFEVLVISNLNVYIEPDEAYNENHRSGFNLSKDIFNEVYPEIELTLKIPERVAATNFPGLTCDEVLTNLDILTIDQKQILVDVFNLSSKSKVELIWHEHESAYDSSFHCHEGKATTPTSISYPAKDNQIVDTE